MHFCFKGFGWNNIEPGISKLLFVFFTVDSLPDRNCPDRNCRRCQPPIEIMLSIAHFKKDDRSWTVLLHFRTHNSHISFSAWQTWQSSTDPTAPLEILPPVRCSSHNRRRSAAEVALLQAAFNGTAFLNHRGLGKFSNGKSWEVQSFKTQLSVWKFYHILICFIMFYLPQYLPVSALRLAFVGCISSCQVRYGGCDTSSAAVSTTKKAGHLGKSTIGHLKNKLNFPWLSGLL